MKLLVIGCGLLGSKLINLVKEKYKTFATYNKELSAIKDVDFFQLNINDKKNVMDVIKKVQPDYIIHTAALTNVDECETNRELAYKTNVDGTRNVALASIEVNARLIYISTDYVFDGVKGRYKEEDKPDPVNYYGLTKLKGEEVVKEICSNWIIARTCALYGLEKKNFVTWIIDELKNGRNINVVTDQFITPTYNLDISQQILELIRKGNKGIFHTAGSERISRYNFALKIAEIFDLDRNLINPVKMEHLNWIAKRPGDSSLNTEKISKIKKPLNVAESLNIMNKS